MQSDRLALGSRHLFANPRFSVDDTLLYLGLVHLVLGQCVNVVDVGCGRGAYATSELDSFNPFDLRGPNRTVLGIDVDPDASQNPYVNEFRLLGGEASAWPVADDSADLLVSDWTLEHVRQPEFFVSEVNRVLRPGGVFIARTVNEHSALAFISRHVPNTRHADVLQKAQPARLTQDIFPAYYLMNSRSKLSELLKPLDFNLSIGYRPGLENYVRGVSPRFAHAIAGIERALPQVLHTVLIVCAEKR